MVEITANYEGGLRCRATHGPSKTELVTDAPVDNMGKGESFSPTDLTVTSLLVCTLTTIGIHAKKRGFEIPSLRARAEKHMSTDAPRRIVKIPVTVWVGLPADHPERAAIEAIGPGCPVNQSLRAEIERTFEFIWE